MPHAPRRTESPARIDVLLIIGATLAIIGGEARHRVLVITNVVPPEASARRAGRGGASSERGRSDSPSSDPGGRPAEGRRPTSSGLADEEAERNPASEVGAKAKSGKQK